MSVSVPSADVPADGPGDVLRELYRRGRLAAEYPRVQRLLGGLSGPELTRVGQLLARLDPVEVVRRHPGVPCLAVAVTGHGTLPGLVAALTGEFARHGLLLRAQVSPFDSYAFALGDPASDLYAAGPQLVLCVLDPAVVFDEVPVPWRASDVQDVLAEKLGVLAGLVARFRDSCPGTLVLNTLPLPRSHAAQLIDLRSRGQLGAVWREFNAGLLRLADAYPRLVVLDLDPILAEGVPAHDPRTSAYARAHLSADLLAGYAREVGQLARHLAGRGRKCLVMDLDQTLWGGVVGEDGVAGIELGDGYRGGAFQSFQRVVKQIGGQGVLLAAVSKNDSEPVRAVFREHPGMVLRESDLVRVVANWRPKHENLVELADDLNLDVDSFVFVDDSPFECGLVRERLPGVAVVQVDDEPALHAGKLLRDGLFDVIELIEDDTRRTARYREESDRRDFMDRFASVEDYLVKLELRVRLFPADDSDVPRIAQLTARTNQFNLTTRRLQPPDVRQLLADPAALVLAVHSADRFGDNGLIAAVLARRERDVLCIENFLLSCRVFARGIEHACLAALLRYARANGAGMVLGEYRPTARNQIVREFYPRNGFREFTTTRDGSGAVVYCHDLTSIAGPPAHIDLTDLLNDSPEQVSSPETSANI